MGDFQVFASSALAAQANAVAQMEMVMLHPRAVRGALMADHHLGYSMPIGGVVAYDGAVSPSGVGFDIGCGNKAVRTSVTAEELRPVLASVADAIQRRVSFGMGRSNSTPFDHPLFDRHAAILREVDELAGRRAALSQKARAQLGTVGAGNHYVDLLADEQGLVWVANHFGSRGLGHTIAKGFLNLAAGERFDSRARDREEPTVLPVDSELGARYLEAMQLAGEYAYAGRDYVADQVLDILGAAGSVLEEVHNHHNFAWFEDGLWVVRKGATPLTREPAFIGGSMGEGAAIVRGVPHPSFPASVPVLDVGALGSAPHGAGRVMSRTKAAGKVKRRTMYGCSVRDCDYELTAKAFSDGGGKDACPTHPRHKLRRFTKAEQKSKGVVDWDAALARLTAAGVELRGGAADEAPEVYKSLEDVLAAHENVEVLRWLRPLAVVMAGPDSFDPYKD